VGKRLRKIAEQTFCLRIILFGQQPHVITEGQETFE
jgi:hypothetical protein